MRKFLCAALLLAAPALVRAADKPDAAAAAVIEKAILAHGGKEALEKYPASESKIKGQMTMFGMDLEFTGDVVSQVPDRAKLSIDMEFQGQKIAVVQVVKGDTVKQTMNGAPAPLDDTTKTELKQILFMQELSNLTPLLKGDKYTVKAEKDDKVGDADAAVVLVTAKGMKDTRLFFDKKTGLLVKSSRKSLAMGGAEPTEVQEETVLSDYKTVNGVKVPMKSVVTQDGKKFMTMTLTDTKMMDKADPKAFAVDD